MHVNRMFTVIGTVTFVAVGKLSADIIKLRLYIATFEVSDSYFIVILFGVEMPSNSKTSKSNAEVSEF